MTVCLITGSAGLVGSEAVNFFSNKFDSIIGIDNDMRGIFFGKNASVKSSLKNLKEKFLNYHHYAMDVRNHSQTGKLFKKYGKNIKLVIHTAAQPSHDWAAQDPFTDFSINASGTLNMLEFTRKHCPDAIFIFTSTNKVYGDIPNKLPFIEQKTRWELPESHPYFNGIDEMMSIDNCMHSLFGASKLSADMMVQEYGKYFGMKTGIFRSGCITGPNHAGVKQQGFLSYLVKCAVNNNPYTIFGHKGKQVRDNIHSYDLVNMFHYFYNHPKCGEVYNAGGGRISNCSVQEAIALCEKITGKKMKITYSGKHRSGDHIWWVSSMKKFQKDYPQWKQKFNLETIFNELINAPVPVNA